MKRKSLAIPLRIHDYSDSSQIVSLLTREAGLVDGLAKGAYRPRSSFQGPFDLAVVYDVVYIERRTTGLALLTESTVVDGLRGVRRRWARHVAASHVIEFLRVVATAGEDVYELFDLALDVLGAIAECGDEGGGETAGVETGGDVAAELLGFDLRALRLLGLLPPVSACVQCGRVWPGKAHPVFFSVEWGGLVCRTCRGRRGAGPGFELAGAAVRILERLSRPRGERVAATGLGEDWVQHRRRLRRAVGTVRTRLLECELTVLQSAAAVSSWSSS